MSRTVASGDTSIMLTTSHTTQPSTEKPCGMRDSPLGALPPELRNNIWELVFCDLWETTALGLFRPERQYKGGHPKLNLLPTCKAINQEAQGFAWHGVRAIINDGVNSVDALTKQVKEEERQRAITPRRERSEDFLVKWMGPGTMSHVPVFTAESAAQHVASLLSQLGSRLGSIVQLDCEHEGVLMRPKYSNEHILDDNKIMATASSCIIPRLHALRKVRFVDHLTFIMCASALPTGRRNFPWAPRKARPLLREFCGTHPGVTELEIRDRFDGYRALYGVAEPITWQISETYFTHLASGTVWEVDGDLAADESDDSD